MARGKADPPDLREAAHDCMRMLLAYYPAQENLDEHPWYEELFKSMRKHGNRLKLALGTVDYEVEEN